MAVVWGTLILTVLRELADLNLFETLVLGEQSSFNPAADFDGNGLVDYIDLQRFSEFLVASEAEQELVTELERIRTLLLAPRMKVLWSAKMRDWLSLQLAF